MNEREFCCPQCHSDNIQSYEIIYNQNVSTSSHTTTGIGMALGGNIGVGSATTSGVSVTDLGQSVAPPQPQKPTYGGLLGGCLVLVCVFLLPFIVGMLVGKIFYFFSASLGQFVMAITTVVTFVAVIILSRRYKVKCDRDAQQWNQEVYPKLMDEWRHTYMCMKCGHRFTLN